MLEKIREIVARQLNLEVSGKNSDYHGKKQQAYYAG